LSSTLHFLQETETEYGEEWERLAFPWHRHEWSCDEDDDDNLTDGCSTSMDDLFCRALRRGSSITLWPVDVVPPQLEVVLRAFCQTLRDTLPLQATLRHQAHPLSRLMIELNDLQSPARRSPLSRIAILFMSPAHSGVAGLSWGWRLACAITEGDEATKRLFCQEMLSLVEEECDTWHFKIESCFPLDVDLFYTLWQLNILADLGAP